MSGLLQRRRSHSGPPTAASPPIRTGARRSSGSASAAPLFVEVGSRAEDSESSPAIRGGPRSPLPEIPRGGDGSTSDGAGGSAGIFDRDLSPTFVASPSFEEQIVETVFGAEQQAAIAAAVLAEHQRLLSLEAKVKAPTSFQLPPRREPPRHRAVFTRRPVETLTPTKPVTVTLRTPPLICTRVRVANGAYSVE